MAAMVGPVLRFEILTDQPERPQDNTRHKNKGGAYWNAPDTYSQVYSSENIWLKSSCQNKGVVLFSCYIYRAPLRRGGEPLHGWDLCSSLGLFTWFLHTNGVPTAEGTADLFTIYMSLPNYYHIVITVVITAVLLQYWLLWVFRWDLGSCTLPWTDHKAEES